MKRFVSILLVLMLALGLAPTAFAAAGGKITGILKPFADDQTGITIQPGQVLEFPLTADMFSWEDGTGEKKEPVSKTKLNSAKVAPKVSYTLNKSKNYVEKIDISTKGFSVTDNEKTAYVRVTFSDSIGASDEVDFSFVVYLTYNNNRIKDSAVEFEGTISPETILVSADEPYVDISDGEVAEAEEYIRSIDLHIGEGIIIRTKMMQDKKYSGKAESVVSEEDSEVLDTYPEIDTVYTLRGTNISSGKVIFEMDDKYYVYDADGKYAGTTNDELKYSNKFYLATEKIDLRSSKKNDDDDDDDDEIIPADDYVDYEDVPTPTNQQSGSNPNDNPGTGAGFALKVCVAALPLAGLAAVLSMRRRRR